MKRITSRDQFKSAGLICALLFTISASDVQAQRYKPVCTKPINSSRYNFHRRRYKRSRNYGRGRYRPQYQPSLDSREFKKHTTWEAPTKEDLRIKEEIEKAQINYGPTSEKVGKLMVKYAQRYYDAKDFEKAEKMSDEIIKLDKVSSIDGISIDEVKKLRQKSISQQKQARIHPDRVGSPANFSIVSSASKRAPTPSTPTATGVKRMVGRGVVEIDYSPDRAVTSRTVIQRMKEAEAKNKKQQQNAIQQQARNYSKMGNSYNPYNLYRNSSNYSYMQQYQNHLRKLILNQLGGGSLKKLNGNFEQYQSK